MPPGIFALQKVPTDPTPWGVVSQGTIGAGNSATQKFPPQAAKAPHLAFLLGKLCEADLRLSHAKPLLLSLRLHVQRKSG